MHHAIVAVPHEFRSFPGVLRRGAPIAAAIIIGAALGMCWALGLHLGVLALVVPAVFMFVVANWVTWFFVALCALWLSPVILGVRFVSDLSPSDPIILILFLLFLARAIAERSEIDFRGPLFIPFLLFFSAQAISAAVMVFRSPTIFFYKDLFPFVKLIEVYLLCIMVGTEVKRGNLRLMLLGAGVVAAVAVGIGFVEHLGDHVVPAIRPFSDMIRKYWYNPFWERSGWPAPTLSRVGGTFDGNPTKLGAFASLFSVIAFAFAVYKRKPLWYRVMFFAVSLIGLMVAISSGSRGALLNSIVGLGAVILLSQRVKIPRKAFIAAAVGCLVLILIVHFSPYGERFQALVEFFQRGARVDRAFYRRIAVRWKFALEEFSRSPIVGRGTVVRLEKGADNVYVNTLQNFGVLGFGSLVYLFWRVLRCGMSVWKRATDEFSMVVALALTCATVGMLFQSFANDIFTFDRLRETYWIVFGLIAGLYEVSRMTGGTDDEGSHCVTHVP